MTLEDIGEWDDALLCLTDQPACCKSPFTDKLGPPVMGDWFFPNGTRLPSESVNTSSGLQWDFFKDRGQSMVHMHRRQGGATGIYHCEIPDSVNVTQAIYIGVYTASTGKGNIVKIFYIFVIKLLFYIVVLFLTSGCVGHD